MAPKISRCSRKEIGWLLYRSVCIDGSYHVRESKFRNPGNFCLWYPENFAYGMWNPVLLELEMLLKLKESGIPLTIGILNPRSTDNRVTKTGIQ